jgi:hypothetical protein
MTKEAHIDAGGHAGLKNVVTIWAEERRLGLVKANGVGKRTD